MPRYVPPFHPFPWPEDLACGEPYINWPSSRDVVSSRTLETQVAVPESWIQVEDDGAKNRTKEGYSLVLTRVRTIGKDTTKFIPMYRNKTFETSDDKFIQPDKYYLEYLGPPSIHSSSQSCDIPYHLLDYDWRAPGLSNHYLARYEGIDWLFHLYSGDTGGNFQGPTKEPLAQSGLLTVCDSGGKHYKYVGGSHGNGFKCVFEEAPTPSSTPPAVPIPKGDKVNLGLAIGLPVGLVGLALLFATLWFSAPALRRRFRRDGGIRL